ncbi:subtilisin-like protease 3 [Zingiber officinale]|uniref:subtilisin-like protease 3 n=1 Tax=Zingiber officinale TaxID=94328 RepID=UPI001C4C7128|nr:subtilisin-like protease 3 [Zingiber officinale]XP_042386018.1 subtilisin-like protease 3 [Zingiber officinale]
MERLKRIHFPLCILLCFALSQASYAPIATPQRQTYIVHVRLPEGIAADQLQETFYRSFLSAVNPELKFIHAYTKVIHGFSVGLSELELAAMSALPGFVRAYPDRTYQLQTTHTPEFLGLHLRQGLWNQSNLGRGIIVGLLDTGIFPDHPSFDGTGMPPPPAKWKGRCDFNASSCNNKLIGARAFIGESPNESPVDDVGHGTHTASTAAGAPVPGAEVLGNAYGVATGMAPLAHIAMYKVCSGIGCASSDILAGMDAAVSDGVDVLSLSLGGPSVRFDEDAIAVGAFGAIDNGVFVSCAAGNSGPDPSSLSNEAPWILTVAAGTMDREIRSTVKLGNGQTLNGESLYQPKSFAPDLYPLVDAGASVFPLSRYCASSFFFGIDVKGKIVLCESGIVPNVQKGVFVKDAGGIGMIVMNQLYEGYTTFPNAHVLPASHVSFAAGDQIRAYINSTTNATAAFLFQGTVLGTSPAPVVSFFSSRGPSAASPGILKPDVIGPGVNVLAAWPSNLSPAPAQGPGFNIISGTSMSTPHLSGIAALIKSAHPDWSPAAIRSAIMTTANVLDKAGNPILNEQHLPADLFSIGAGYVNPIKAGNPGLVYDISPDDYISYLCGLGYTDAQLNVITRRNTTCQSAGSIQEKDLNYPSISVALSANATTVTLERRLKNVGAPSATYMAVVGAPSGVNVRVYPSILRFNSLNQEMKFSVTLNMAGGGSGGASATQGYLKWISSQREVRSPISVTYKM